MRKILGLLILYLAALAIPVRAQVSTPSIIFVNTDPSGSCANAPPMRYNYTDGYLWACKNGTWTNISTSGGSGGGYSICASGCTTSTFPSGAGGTISAATHGQGVDPSIWALDNASPANYVYPPAFTVQNDGSGNLTFYFTTQPSRIQIGNGAGGVGSVTSVSFTGGIISVANPTSTPALTVAMTSGGIVYGASSSTWASSAALTHYGVLFGGGVGGAPTSSAQGGSNFPLIGQGTANPIFSTIAYLTSATANDLIYASSSTALAALATANSGVLVTSSGGAPSISTTLPSNLAMGTPASLTLTNATGLPIAGITGLGTGVATALAASVSGSGAICLASGSACTGGGGGGTGNAGAQGTVTGTTSITYTCPSSTAGTVVTFEYTLTATSTSATLSGCTQWSILVFPITQAASGGPYTNAWPTGFSQFGPVSPVAGVTTTCWALWDGTTAQSGGCDSSAAPAVAPTSTFATITVPSGYIAYQPDSTLNTLRSKDSSGNFYAMAKELASAAPRCAGGADAVDSACTASQLNIVGPALVQNCGTTSTCSHTALTSSQVVMGSAALVSGTPSTVTITGISPAFTSSTSYVCSVTAESGASSALLSVANVSGSSFTITGPATSTTVINYVCAGN